MRLVWRGLAQHATRHKKFLCLARLKLVWGISVTLNVALAVNLLIEPFPHAQFLPLSPSPRPRLIEHNRVLNTPPINGLLLRLLFYPSALPRLNIRHQLPIIPGE